MKKALLLAALLASAAAQDPAAAVIRSGVPWTDTSGDRIYAGGANLYLEENIFYLVGEGKKTLSGDISACFNLYSSPDLATWTPLGCILKNADVVAPPPFDKESVYRIERPKILKCPGATSKPYRLIHHCDTDGFAMRSIGVLSADAVTGPYTYMSPCFRPDGEDSFDMGTFLDDTTNGGDGKVYLIRSVQNKYAGISAFTEACDNTTGIISSGPDMEGQAIMRANGTLYAAGSHLTGWASNAAQFVTTTSKTLSNAQWVDNYNPSGSDTTYNSQSTFIFPFKHKDGHITYIWMADRWNEGGPGGLDNMTNIWLPMIPPTGTAPSKPAVGWTLSLAACDASDALQGWALDAASATMTHTASGLCVANLGGSAGGVLTLATCGASDGSQTWHQVGNGEIASTAAGGQGALCVNNDNNVLPAGNPVIAYDCGSSPAWNALWRVARSSVEALDASGKRSGMCASVGPASNPSQWTLPWLPEWSLKDF